MNEQVIRIDKELCTNCGLCLEVCVLGIIEEGEAAPRITLPAFCMLCGHCKSVCPTDAIQLPSLNQDEFEPAPSKDQHPRPERLLALFRSRRSIRFFKKDPVERQNLEQIIEAGRYAPTGGNRQPLRYTVVHKPEKVETIRVMALESLMNQAARIDRAMTRRREEGRRLTPADQILQAYALRWHEIDRQYKQGRDLLFYHAPAVIVCHVNPEASTHTHLEAGLAAMQMVLMAEVLGLGTCFTGFLDFAVRESSELKKELNIRQGHEVPTSFVIGRPDITFERLAARKPAKVSWF